MNQPDKPGFYYGVPFDEYQEWPAINISLLKEMDKTPLHAFYRRTHPLEATEEMQVGSAAHCQILDPDKWDSRFYVCPPCKLNTKEGKEIMAQAIIEANGRTVVRMSDDSEASAAEEIAKAIKHHELAWKLISAPGKCEVSALWFDDMNEQWCKGRFDKIIPGADGEASTLLELKTSGQIDDFHFSRTAKTLHYDAQAAWYLWGFACLTGENAIHNFLAIESKAPYSCRILQMNPDSMTAGTDDYAKWYGSYCRCLKTRKWPGYPNTVQTLILPQFGDNLELIVRGREYAL